MRLYDKQKNPYYRRNLENNNGQYKWLFDSKDFTYEGDAPESNQNIRNLYKTAILDLDNEIEYFYKNLKKLNLTTNSSLIITSDHGEALFDNDLRLFSHNNIDALPVINVPFYVFKDGIEARKIDKGNFALIDALNLAQNLQKSKNYEREFIYIEADFDLTNKNSPLYVFNIDKIFDTSNINNVKIKNYDVWHTYKRRAVLYKNFLLKYEFNTEGEEDKYHLYNTNIDPLFQKDIKYEDEEIFNLLKGKLKEFRKDGYQNKH